MERRPVQIQFRIKGPIHPPPRQQRQNNVDRGRYGPPHLQDNRLGFEHRSGVGGGRMTFVRNPKFPKSLYDVEMSMRHIVKGKPVKLTPGMSFPDPKANRSISNPAAPHFRYHYEPTAEDYNIIHNPLAGTDDPANDTGSNLASSSRYIETVRYDSSDDSDDDGDNADGGLAILDDDSQISEADEEENDDDIAAAEAQQEELMAVYSHVKHNAHRIREAQVMVTQPPAFEPQPPPPRAPVDPVLVIPRAVVREEKSHREHRFHDADRNGDRHDVNNNV